MPARPAGILFRADGVFIVLPIVPSKLLGAQCPAFGITKP